LYSTVTNDLLKTRLVKEKREEKVSELLVAIKNLGFRSAKFMEGNPKTSPFIFQSSLHLVEQDIQLDMM
jgi:hypothetical protein